MRAHTRERAIERREKARGREKSRESERERQRRKEEKGKRQRERVCVRSCVCRRGGKNKFVSVISEDDSRLQHLKIKILAPPPSLQTDAIERKSTQPDVFAQTDV